MRGGYTSNREFNIQGDSKIYDNYSRSHPIGKNKTSCERIHKTAWCLALFGT